MLVQVPERERDWLNPCARARSRERELEGEREGGGRETESVREWLDPCARASSRERERDWLHPCARARSRERERVTGHFVIQEFIPNKCGVYRWLLARGRSRL